MQQPPPLNTCLRYPITTGVAIMSIAATLRWWGGADIERFLIGDERWLSQPWRLVTPVLFHGDILHLLFNLYWLWVFGTIIEAEFGSGKTLAIYVMLAIGSGLAELALLHGGIGLSGVGYGLFGLLWVLGQTDRRFRGVIDRQTTHLFIGWFFFCIVATVADVMHVANVAHGMGFVLGTLLGWTIVANSVGRRVRNGAVLASVFLLCMAGGSVARPYINLSKDTGPDYAYRGYEALVAKNPERAVTLYHRAIVTDPHVASWWHNLGVAYHRLGQTEQASDAFQHAAELDPQSEDDR
jgi:membrane associated rhomboid family serine protease